MTFTFNYASDPENKCAVVCDRALEQGINAQIAITPSSGYSVTKVTGTGCHSVQYIALNTYRLVNITGNVNVMVTLTLSTNKQTNIQPFVCLLTFEKNASIKFSDGTSITVPKEYNFMSAGEQWEDPNPVSGSTHLHWNLPRGGFKWDRNLNKNAIYIQLPVGEGVNDEADPSNDGGYGYDLGFVQDNIVLTLQTASYLDYQKFMALTKTNTGESVATLTIGYTNTTEDFKVLVRYCNASSTPGSQMITLNVTLTVVSAVYTQ